MKKVYQIFISSTYTDLEKERFTVLNALLSINCLPAGMEYFPSASEEQFEFIKRIIDRSDYYVLIIGGRYGSVDETGVSYTEKEYDYAVAKGVPVLTFVRKNIDDIPAKYVERDEVKRAKLEQFKKKVMKGKLCSFWTQEYELSTKVISSLENAFGTFPRPGMVRLDDMDEATQESHELSVLRDHAQNQEILITDIKNELEQSRMILETLNTHNTRPRDIQTSRSHRIKKVFYSLTGKTSKPMEEEFSNRELPGFNMTGYMFLSHLVQGCKRMSDERVGGLIAIEMHVPLTDYMQTGVYMDCIVSSETLHSIFASNRSLLHDGAVIIRGTRIIASSCYFPVTDRDYTDPIPLGTRHRAAIGITEATDAVAIVTSEATGNMSIAYKGKLYQKLNDVQLMKELKKVLCDKYVFDSNLSDEW